MSEIVVGVGALQPDDVVAVARRNARVVLAPAAEAEIERSRKVIEALAADAEPHYGVSTGFGALATRHIPVALRGPAAAQPDPLARGRLRG